MDGRALLAESVRRALDILIAASKKELIDQGHRATGRSIKSLRTEVEVNANYEAIGRIYGAYYLKYVDKGTKPHVPPFQALYEWAKVVFTGTEAETKSFAYAVQSAIAKQGTPTSGSFSYSNNGRRTEWSRFAAAESVTDMGKEIAASRWVLEAFKIELPTK